MDNTIAHRVDNWNASRYRDRFQYVPEIGKTLVEALAPMPGQRVLDLGCGTGELTMLIAELGASVVGIDASKNMIAAAKERYPSVDFRLARAEEYHHEVKFDAVFSNLAMHWIKTPLTLLERIFESLHPGGRLVTQTGCDGNHAALIEAVVDVSQELNLPFENPWYYPRLGEYAGLLDHCGYEIELAKLIAQSNTLEGGKSGLRWWLEMYLPNILERAGVKKNVFLEEVESRLRQDFFKGDSWVLKFRRMRIIARRPNR